MPASASCFCNASPTEATSYCLVSTAPGRGAGGGGAGSGGGAPGPEAEPCAPFWAHKKATVPTPISMLSSITHNSPLTLGGAAGSLAGKGTVSPGLGAGVDPDV